MFSAVVVSSPFAFRPTKANVILFLASSSEYCKSFTPLIVTLPSVYSISESMPLIDFLISSTEGPTISEVAVTFSPSTTQVISLISACLAT